jgi:hypothetical protein
MQSKVSLINEIRYSERLCLRTARLYRHAQTFGTFCSILGGSAAAVALAPQVPQWVGLAGLVGLAVFGAFTVAIRPADKAAANENDARRYAQLRTAAAGMNAEQLAAALDKARETDTPEIESLRDVAWNDVAREIGAATQQVALARFQRILAALA